MTKPDPDEPPIGERVRSHRLRQGRTQAAVAGLAGIAEDYLSQIERGHRTPTVAVLRALARELGVPVSALLGERHPTAPDRIRAGLGAVEHALVGITPPAPPAETPDLPGLRDRVEHAWRTYQTSPTRFTDTATLLPPLITDTEQALRTLLAPGEQDHRREAHRIAADLYTLLRTWCKRTGRPDLSLLAADRARRSAHDADDPLRIAAADWNLGHVLLNDGEPEAAETVARHAAATLGPWREHRERAAMYGALHLVVAVALARRRMWWHAREVIRDHAHPAAGVSGEGNIHHTVFGPSNVQLHRVSIEMESGEAATALRLARDVDPYALPSVERRATHLLELTRCHEQRREDPAVLLHLRQAEETAPEDVHNSLLAQDMVRDLRRRARPSYSREVAALAARMGILAN
ncbi:helix-turn-helix domain-containing protein [Embleya sp. NPDC050493]|uniref:helix-turn-helix domain-containing protein n=1 Tax=Embleya sp. NPDC050493 TaxID=3363989 RepID=UPI0037A84CC0